MRSLSIICALFLLFNGLLVADAVCRPKFDSRGKCREDGLQDVVTTYYVWNKELSECVRKLQMSTLPCDRIKAKSGKCPEPRVVEPGECDNRNKLQKTLVSHYEPDGKGNCELFTDYIFPKCPELKTKEDDCPEPRYFQKPCRKDRTRSVYKHTYFKVKDECKAHISIKNEPCASFGKSIYKCPDGKTVPLTSCANCEKHPCFKKILNISYEVEKGGGCKEVAKNTLQLCSTRKKSKGCLKKVTTSGRCVDGIKKILNTYYVKLKNGKCSRRFDIEEIPCGNKKKNKCPQPRTVEPGPCVDGKSVYLVVHYEPDEKTGRCKTLHSQVTKKCGAETVCDDPKYKQLDCVKGFRIVYKYTFTYVKAIDKCVKHVELNREPCAALEKTKSCPSDDTLESGPCVDGFRVDIVYTYSRKADGTCAKEEHRINKSCKAEAKSACKKQSKKKLKACKDGIQKWIITEYIWNKTKNRCTRKIRFEETSCKTSKSTCPTARVVEPGPCDENGKRRILVEHFEFSKEKRKCVMFKDKVEQDCPKLKKPGEKLTPAEEKAEKSAELCKDPVIHQKACSSNGYRIVFKIYYLYEKYRRGCVKKIDMKQEQCAKFVKSSCPPDDIVESGPCEKSGFRTDIVFGYVRDEKGVCKKREKHVTKPCNIATRHKCKPMRTKKLRACDKSGVEKYLTTYYLFDKEKNRCVRKLKYKEKVCKNAGKKCPGHRIVEPAPCENGYSRTLIEHYEYHEDLLKCVLERHYLKKPCGKNKEKRRAVPLSKHMLKKKKKSKNCPDPEYHQKPCKASGYRTVIKSYSMWEESLKKCSRKIDSQEEKCATLLKTDCAPDEVLEAGPCVNGFRMNIIYKYSRDEHGDCNKKEVHVNETCVTKKFSD